MTFNILTSIGYTEKSPAGPKMAFCGSYNKAVFVNIMYMHNVIYFKWYSNPQKQ